MAKSARPRAGARGGAWGGAGNRAGWGVGWAGRGAGLGGGGEGRRGTGRGGGGAGRMQTSLASTLLSGRTVRSPSAVHVRRNLKGRNHIAVRARAPPPARPVRQGRPVERPPPPSLPPCPPPLPPPLPPRRAPCCGGVDTSKGAAAGEAAVLVHDAAAVGVESVDHAAASGDEDLAVDRRGRAVPGHVRHLARAVQLAKGSPHRPAVHVDI